MGGWGGFLFHSPVTPSNWPSAARHRARSYDATRGFRSPRFVHTTCVPIYMYVFLLFCFLPFRTIPVRRRLFHTHTHTHVVNRIIRAVTYTTETGETDHGKRAGAGAEKRIKSAPMQLLLFVGSYGTRIYRVETLNGNQIPYVCTHTLFASVNYAGGHNRQKRGKERTPTPRDSIPYRAIILYRYAAYSSETNR